MSAESIVVSLDMAKRLAKAGWQQDDFTFFFAVIEHKHGHAGSIHFRENYYGEQAIASIMRANGLLAAPTAEEILRRLPMAWITIISDGNEYCLQYERGNRFGFFCKTNEEFNSSLANAAAAMWCHLKENNLLP